MKRKVFVISDLHLSANFKIFNQGDRLSEFIKDISNYHSKNSVVELVINGDFFDFLAENFNFEDFQRNPHVKQNWKPFEQDSDRAKRILYRIRDSENKVFESLISFLKKGNILSILLGNHDLEMSFPELRRELHKILGCDFNGNLNFIFDNEAYLIGDVLIEHGNRYDEWNVIDHDTLRQIRSLMSRHQKISFAKEFVPSAGSQLVAKVMNPIKTEFPFIDLIKPEFEAAVPICCAIRPTSVTEIENVLKLYYQSTRDIPFVPDIPAVQSKISGLPNSLRGLFDRAFGLASESFYDLILSLGKETKNPQKIGLGLLAAFDLKKCDKRTFQALELALKNLAKHSIFSGQKKNEKKYYDAAEEILKSEKIKHIIIGHSHIAESVEISTGKRLFNSGSWVDSLKFSPDSISTEEKLRTFIKNLKDQTGITVERNQPHIYFEFDTITHETSLPKLLPENLT